MRRAYLVSLVLLLFVGPAVADYSHGTAVDKKDYDYFPTPKFNAIALCFIDDDGSGTVDLDEVLYLKYKSAACGTVAGKDWRLLDAKQIKSSTDSQWGITLTAVPGAHMAAYYDEDGDGKLKKDDTAYIDINGDGVVSVPDVRLMAFGDLDAFVYVRAGDADLNLPLTAIGAIGTAGVTFEAGKGLYINADGSAADTVIEEGDVRLTKVPTPWEAVAQAITGAPELEIVSSSESTGAGFRLITTVVRNAGDVTGSGLLETEIGGVTVDARGTPTLAPGDEATLVIALPLPATGSDSVSSGAVGAVQGFKETFEPGTNTPGAGVALIGLALVAAVFVARRF